MATDPIMTKPFMPQTPDGILNADALAEIEQLLPGGDEAKYIEYDSLEVSPYGQLKAMLLQLALFRDWGQPVQNLLNSRFPDIF